jgi:ribosomal-protein-alanine N-acetyltransferase
MRVADNVAARCFYNEHGYHERLLKARMYGEAVDGIRLEKWLRVQSSAAG